MPDRVNLGQAVERGQDPGQPPGPRLGPGIVGDEVLAELDQRMGESAPRGVGAGSAMGRLLRDAQ